MKKILLSTIILTAFSLSVILFQISCKKDSKAQTLPYTLPPATTSKLGGVIPDGSTISVDVTGKISAINTNAPQAGKIIFSVVGTTQFNSQIWTANYDGSNAHQIIMSLPANISYTGNGISISPDHKTIFFSAYNLNPGGSIEIYACNVDGSNAHQVISEATNVDIKVAY